MEEKELLVGAEEIARAFRLKPRQVYNLRESGKAPIKNTPGLGLTASKSELQAYLYGKHTAAQVPEEKR